MRYKAVSIILWQIEAYYWKCIIKCIFYSNSISGFLKWNQRKPFFQKQRCRSPLINESLVHASWWQHLHEAVNRWNTWHMEINHIDWCKRWKKTGLKSEITWRVIPPWSAGVAPCHFHCHKIVIQSFFHSFKQCQQLKSSF